VVIKVLHLNYTDSGGGAAIAALRLVNALREHGVNATLGVIDKRTNDPAVVPLRKQVAKQPLVVRIFIKLRRKIQRKLDPKLFKTTNQIMHSENKKSLIDIRAINYSDYDIVHLHWINDDTISIEDIAKITKPIVWTMHDSWVFCGAEHHPNVLENDRRFIEGYTAGNKPRTTQGFDICGKTWRRKKSAWGKCRFHFAAPSNFERDRLRESALFGNAPSAKDCVVIPNIVPDSIFRPLDKSALRKMYNIPAGKKVIGFGATGSIDDKRSIKGGALLLTALNMIESPADYFFVVIGSDKCAFQNTIPIETMITGFISNEYILNTLYNLCDIFVCPSIIENLPNVCIEAMRCGVPVVAFRTGGIPDIVEHQRTGYLAVPFDTADLYAGIRYCEENHAELSRNALEKAADNFDNECIARKHRALYERVLRGPAA
jgi:glycosyltransferase involved in cell wall biosynthesis